MNRSLHRLFLAMSAGFVLLILMLGYWQVVDASDLRERGDNTQAQRAERLIDRGIIYSADGRRLAVSRPRRVDGQRIYERVYPQKTVAAHVVGYAAPMEGKTGVEAAYDRYLTGSFGSEPLLQRLNLREKRGANVQLTIDTRIQAAAERAFSTGMRGAVVAIDPATGHILAMHSAPTFDLSQVVSGGWDRVSNQPNSPLVNRATAGRYAPGSTFKVVTATSALTSGIYQPDFRFPGGASYPTPGSEPIRNFGGRSFGPHTLTDALTNSINTTFAEIGETLGPDRMAATMDDYGFGTRPGIDLPQNEVIASGRYSPDGRTLLANAEQGVDVARLAIGQEQLVGTPLQMAMVAATIGNGGMLMQPQVVSRVTDRAGAVVRRNTPQELGRVAEPAVMTELTQMMTRVVDEGTGTAASLQVELPGVRVAGKTGTAETNDPEANNAWFIGFAPAENPTVAVAVVVEATPGQGGTVAAPIAAQVMSQAIEAR